MLTDTLHRPGLPPVGACGCHIDVHPHLPPLTRVALSLRSIVGVFTLFVTDAALCRHVFNHNGPDTLLMQLHPSAKNILGERNIAFLHGPEHKAMRKSFIALFTRKALGVYVRKQDQIIK